LKQLAAWRYLRQFEIAVSATPTPPAHDENPGGDRGDLAGELAQAERRYEHPPNARDLLAFYFFLK
jgi:hypothetical protein